MASRGLPIQQLVGCSLLVVFVGANLASSSLKSKWFLQPATQTNISDIKLFRQGLKQELVKLLKTGTTHRDQLIYDRLLLDLVLSALVWVRNGGAYQAERRRAPLKELTDCLRVAVLGGWEWPEDQFPWGCCYYGFSGRLMPPCRPERPTREPTTTSPKIWIESTLSSGRPNSTKRPGTSREPKGFTSTRPKARTSTSTSRRPPQSTNPRSKMPSDEEENDWLGDDDKLDNGDD